MRHRLVSFFAVLACFLIFGIPTHSQSLFERLVMPGNLVSGHAELQKECSNCHESFSQGAQDQLCLDCHKDVDADITDSNGFHGKSPETNTNQCSHCHTDHIGEDADIILFDTEVFNHELTDFTLVGRHLETTCTNCHEVEKDFRDAPMECVSCHREDDAHKGNLGQNCADCHNETAWVETKTFDHFQTSFPLTEAHAEAECSACHVGEIYKDLPETCVGCHRIQDIHQGRFGPKCESCHQTTNWSTIRFDHDRDTDFTLTGRHQKIACDECHAVNVFEHETATDCVGCHQNDDPHKGSLGRECTTCHNTNGWRDAVLFDHDLASFPLIGLHLLETCESCHQNGMIGETRQECATCHQNDDPHAGRLGEKCETCHNPNGWEFWIFDHNRQTDFNLTGGHNGLECAACHKANGPMDLGNSTACVSCHTRNDVHRGGFSDRCDLCHSTTSFSGARLR